MKSQHQRLNVAVTKIPVGGQFHIVQMRAVLKRAGDETRFHDHDDTCGRARPCEAIAGSSRQHVDRAGAIVCAVTLTLRGPLGLDISTSEKVQEVSRMIMLGDRDAWHVTERFQCNAVPSGALTV